MAHHSDAELLIGSPRGGIEIPSALETILSTSLQPWKMRFGFAYVSNAGLDTLLSAIEETPSWGQSPKLWLLGIHHGITEPLAIERLRDSEKTKVRLFTGGKTLSAGSLAGNALFHAKLALLERGRGKKREVHFAAGSANLTGAALGPGVRNYEAGFVVSGSSANRAAGSRFNSWWKEAWSGSVTATDAVITKYSKLRDGFIKRNPDSSGDLDPPSPPRIPQARTLWIEAGAMSGGSRNQVEFNEDLAAFFGPAQQHIRNLRMIAGEYLLDDRPLSPKTTTFGVNIWRLSLPTEAKGGFDYPGNVIRIRKRKDAKGKLFEVDVAAFDSPAHRRWRATAHRRGYIGVTSGQRSYGFYG